MSDHGGPRRGAGLKRKYELSENQRTTVVRRSLVVFERWHDQKIRFGFKTHSQVSEYLLTTADAFDSEPTPR